MNTHFRKTLIASALAVTMAGPAAADTLSQDVTEARQETQIWTTYALSPYLRASDLKVAVDNGTATLSGTVEESVNKDLAREIAMGVSGIKDVDNQIVVQADYVAPARSSERSYGEKIDDATITSTVKSKLVWSRHTEGLSTNVDTVSGKVTLKGTADSAAAKDLAGRLAANTRGVSSVDNRLKIVKAPAGIKADTPENVRRTGNETKMDVADSWITTKVKSTLLYSSNVDGTDIKVSTTNGIVTLSGKVDSGAERALAIELTENVRGVKNVQAKGLSS